MLHFQNGPVIEASTSEWAVKKQLFKTNDHSAFSNLGRVFAQRCLESGFIEMHCGYGGPPGGKIHAFLMAVQKSGVNLREQGRVRVDKYYDRYETRSEKPYDELE